MNKKLQKHIEELHIIDNQRKGWLVLSAFVSIGVLGIIFGWNAVRENQLVWVVVSLGLIVSMIWWYWTMRLVRHLINYKVTESEILTDVVREIRSIKREIVKILPPSVDKDN